MTPRGQVFRQCRYRCWARALIRSRRERRGGICFVQVIYRTWNTFLSWGKQQRQRQVSLTTSSHSAIMCRLLFLYCNLDYFFSLAYHRSLIKCDVQTVIMWPKRGSSVTWWCSLITGGSLGCAQIYASNTWIVALMKACFTCIQTVHSLV